MGKLKDPVLSQNSEAYHETLNALHREYGPIVTLDQVKDWLHKQGFDEKSVEPTLEFADLPKTKFVKEGHPLEYRVTETSNIPNGPCFAVLIAYGKRYTAHMPLNSFPARKSA